MRTGDHLTPHNDLLATAGKSSHMMMMVMLVVTLMMLFD